MSSKSIDPISRRRKGAADPKRSSVVPRTADTAKVLEKAQAALEARKESKSRSNRKLIFGVLVIALVVFLVGGGLTSWQVYQKDSQQKEQDQTKQAVLDSLKQFSPVKDYSDDDLNKLYDQVGAEYAAAEKIGIGLDPNSSNDKALLGFMTAQKQDTDSVSESVKKIINARLEVAKTDGYYEGYIFYYWFGNSIVNKYPDEQIDGWGDPNVLAGDKAYAESRAKEDRQKLVENKTSPEEIIKVLTKDRRLQLGDEMNSSSRYETMLESMSMTTDDGRSESANKLINKYSKPGITEIGIITADPGTPVSGNKREVGYVFLKLDVVLKGQDAISKYEDEVRRAKESMGS